MSAAAVAQSTSQSVAAVALDTSVSVTAVALGTLLSVAAAALVTSVSVAAVALGTSGSAAAVALGTSPSVAAVAQGTSGSVATALGASECRSSSTGYVRECRGSSTGYVRKCRGSSTGYVRECRGSSTGYVRECRGSSTGHVRECRRTTQETLLFKKTFFFFNFLQLYCPSGISPMGNSGCLPRGKPVATESRYPSYGACWVFLIFPANSDMVFRIFNLCTNVNACGCTQGCTDTVRESAPKAASGRKISCHTGEPNLPQRRAGTTLYQLSYIPIPSAIFNSVSVYCIAIAKKKNYELLAHVVSLAVVSVSNDTMYLLLVSAQLYHVYV